MSERYGSCPACNGYGSLTIRTGGDKRECGRCGGTGFDGSSEAYLEREGRREWDRESHKAWSWGISEHRAAVVNVDQKFYSGAKKTRAMDLAIAALESHLNKQTNKGKVK